MFDRELIKTNVNLGQILKNKQILQYKEEDKQDGIYTKEGAAFLILFLQSSEVFTKFRDARTFLVIY